MRFLSIGCAALLPLASAYAQPAQPRLQDARVVARGGTISITRLPIQTPTGTIYRDVTIELHVDADGRVTLATDGAGRAVSARMQPSTRVALRSVPSGQASSDQSIELPQRPSAPIVMQRFTPGSYTTADGALFELHDRGMDLIHHVPMWVISGGGVLESATFYSGPPFMSPLSGRLKRRDIVSEDFAYGASDGGASDAFGTGALVGVAQHGRQLQIVSFRHGCCWDQSTPTTALNLTYVGR